MLFDPLPAGSTAMQERYRFMQLRTTLSKDIIAVLSLAAIWAITEMLIHPAGEFPLNDDWSYTLSLQQWYDKHQYRLLGWTSMPLLSQLTWGLLFCKLFGFSFTVLRYSTLVLGLAGGIGAYFLCREFSHDKGACFLAALILLFNPIYLNLSNTFMTDVPFTSFLIFSLLFFVKGLRQEKTAYILQGVFFVLVATLERQLGLLAAAAFALALVLKHNFSRKALLTAFISLGLPVGLYLLYNFWLKTQHDYPVKYNEGVHRIRYNLFSNDHSAFQFLLRQALNIFIYAGFFIFPFIFRVDWKAIWQRRRTPAFIVCVTIMMAAGIYCLIQHNHLALMGNIMNPYGLGVVDLRDGQLLDSGNLRPLPAILWQLVCAAGIIGGTFLIWSLFQNLKGLHSRPPLFFLLGFCAFYSFIMLVGGTYDRYLIPLIPVLIILLMTGTAEKSIERHTAAGVPPHRRHSIGPYAAVVFLLTGAWFSIAGTANYLGWNRARWEALYYLVDDAGVPPAQIDGGFAFNGYYNYNESDISKLKDHPGPGRKSWWWVQDDVYMISFGPLDGYSVLKTYPCPGTLFPASMKSIYVLKRAD